MIEYVFVQVIEYVFDHSPRILELTFVSLVIYHDDR